MNELSKRLIALRKSHTPKLSQQAVADIVGVTRAAVTQWERGETKPKSAAAHALARLYGVSISHLLFGEDNDTPQGEGLMTLLPAVPGGRSIPIIDYIQAGVWTESCGSASGVDGEVETISTDVPCGACSFALRVNGESMAPDYRPGDVVVVDPDLVPRPGEIVVARNGHGEATLKQYRPRGINEQGQEWFELIPLNDVFPPMRSDRQEIHIIGVVIEHRRYMRTA